MPITSGMYEGLVKHDAQLSKLYLDLKNMNDILKLFPVTDIGRSRVSAQVVDRLPEGGYRDINESFTEDEGTTRPKEDLISIFGSKFRVDIAYDDYTQEPKLMDQVEAQFMMYKRSTSLQITDDIINGDVDVNEKGFDGLFKRLSNGDQDSANLIQCASADVLKPRTSAANATAYLEYLDEALMEAGLLVAANGSNVRGAILMNKEMFLAHSAAVKASGLTDTNVNMLGYIWPTYMGLPIIRTPNKPDKVTPIIPNDIDTLTSGGAQSTRIFVVRLASAPMGDSSDTKEAVRLIQNPGGDGLQLIQAGMLKRFEPTRPEPEYTVHGFQWQLGVSTVTDSSCIAALENISPAKA